MDDKVILYHQEGCPQCLMAKMILEKRGIAHEECSDVAKMASLGITHTPTLSVNGKLLTGKAMMDWMNGKRQ